jgi:hypothetical protein
MTNAQINRIKPLINELAPRLNAYLKSIGTSRRNPETQ